MFNRLAGAVAIILVSASLGMLVDWQAPGVQRNARDWLMRARGMLAAPDDIAIVAVDEPSIARFGRFPWPRSIMARAIEKIAEGQPKVIALDVLYTDRTAHEEDHALAKAVAGAGNVVMAALLADPPAAGGPATWLLPLPVLSRAALAVGHVNVLTESEGIARELLIRAADDAGRPLHAMVVEAVRIGDGIPPEGITNAPHAALVGSRVIPVQVSTPSILVKQSQSASNSPKVLRADRMAIDYIGPAGSFASSTSSIADVVEGRFQRRDSKVAMCWSALRRHR